MQRRSLGAVQKSLHPHLVDGVSKTISTTHLSTVALIHADKIDVESIIYSSLFFSLFSPCAFVSLLFFSFIYLPSRILADIIQFLTLLDFVIAFVVFFSSFIFLLHLFGLCALSVCLSLLDLR